VVQRLDDYLEHEIPMLESSKLRTATVVDQSPKMVTIVFDAGKKNKLRPGDILGALTREDAVKAEFVGKIDVFPFHAYVAVHRSVIDEAFHVLRTRKIKGRKIRVRELDW
jgi:ATP-independent RNA helicase DbpA